MDRTTEGQRDFPQMSSERQCKLSECVISRQQYEVGTITYPILPMKKLRLTKPSQFSHSVVSDSLWPHGLQHSRLPCPSPVPEFSQTHVHGIGNAIQPSHPLLSPYPSALKLSQHQGLFQRVSSSHQVAKVGVSTSASVLPMNIQDWYPLCLTALIFWMSKGLSRVFSNTTVKSIN